MFSIHNATLVATCVVTLSNPALAGSDATMPTNTGNAQRTRTVETALADLQDRLAKFGDQARQVGEDAAAAGRAAVDAALAKLREREQARRAAPSSSTSPVLGVDVSNI
jgi:hypothetical protein